MKKVVIALLSFVVVGTSLTTNKSDAQENQSGPVGNDTPCALSGNTLQPPQSEDFVFFSPDETAGIKKSDGSVATVVCRQNGSWHVVVPLGVNNQWGIDVNNQNVTPQQLRNIPLRNVPLRNAP